MFSDLSAVCAAARTASHIYLMPHPLLRPYIAHYTLTVPGGETSGEGLTLIPDAAGCIVLRQAPNGLSGCIWGATTRTVTVTNDLAYAPPRFFIEFMPAGLNALTGIPQTELADKRFSLDLVDSALANSLSHAFLCATGFEMFIKRVDALLLGHLGGRETPAAVRGALAQLRASCGTPSVKEICAGECYSARHMNRLFGACIGLPVKLFARLVRVNAAIQRMECSALLTGVALEAGFYDQAHFIHDFKEICGVTPREYQCRMSGFYNEIYKF